MVFPGVMLDLEGVGCVWLVCYCCSVRQDGIASGRRVEASCSTALLVLATQENEENEISPVDYSRLDRSWFPTCCRPCVHYSCIDHQ